MIIYLIYELIIYFFKLHINKTSLKIKKLEEINYLYKDKFIKISTPFLEHKYDNANFYMDISCKDYLIYSLERERYKDVFPKINEDVESNKKNFTIYTSEIESSFVNLEAANHNKFYIYYENKIINKTKLQPVLDFNVTVTLILTNINGVTKNRKMQKFSYDDVSDITSKLNQRRGIYYLDKEIWNSLCRVERGKVTNKLRFYIYNRDGYKCKKCGKNGKYANLEVDHIVPISRGGLSTSNNLQTLCHDCNMEKGTNIRRY